MAYIKQTVARPEGSPGAGIIPRDELLFIDVEDIDFFPSRDEAGVLIEDDIILKDGAYPYGVYATPGTTEMTETAEGDTDAVGFKPSLKFKHPGNTQEAREFKANNINRRLVVLQRHCNGAPTDIIGSPCNPCRLIPSYSASADSNFNEFTVEQVAKGAGIGIYEGMVPSAEEIPLSELPEGGTLYLNPSKAVVDVSGCGTVMNIITSTNFAEIKLVNTGKRSNKANPKVYTCSIYTHKKEEDKNVFGTTDIIDIAPGQSVTLRGFSTPAGCDFSETNFVWFEVSRKGY